MKKDPLIPWLLEAGTPSIRYLTLIKLLDMPETTPEVQTAWKEMQTSGPIPAILSGQTEAGSWAGEYSYYTPKYTSTHWSMLLLAELATDSTDIRLQRGANFMLSATANELKPWMQDTHGITCFWANLLRYTLHCGLQDDMRLSPILEKVVSDAIRFNWRCAYNYNLPCAWGAARALWAFAALPSQLQTQEVKAAINSALEFLLVEHNVLQINFPLTRNLKHSQLWGKLSFPLFYQADILLILRALTELGMLDHPGARPLLDWLIKRRNKNGHWRGVSPFRSRTWKELGESEETKRWVSFFAAWILKHSAESPSHRSVE